jgi:hypothetical protein
MITDVERPEWLVPDAPVLVVCGWKVFIQTKINRIFRSTFTVEYSGAKYSIARQEWSNPLGGTYQVIPADSKQARELLEDYTEDD